MFWARGEPIRNRSHRPVGAGLPVSYTVTLAAVGNPDRRQPTGRLRGVPNLTARCDTLEECSTEVRTYIEENDLGGGNWDGGEVRDGSGKFLGSISYNGRYWPGKDWRKL
jgi:hypothetical protein